LAVVTRDPVSAVDAFYDPLFAQLPLPAFLIDRDLKVASVNTEFQRSFLVSPDAVVGRNAAVLFVRDELPRLVALLGRLRRHELDDDLGGWDVHGPQGEVVRARIRMRAIDLDGARFTMGVLVDVRRRDRALQGSFEPARGTAAQARSCTEARGRGAARRRAPPW